MLILLRAFGIKPNPLVRAGIGAALLLVGVVFLGLLCELAGGALLAWGLVGYTMKQARAARRPAADRGVR
ncbi:MAG: hypothetical protein ACRDJU_15220 [Actinomycetota bacterium]